MKKEVIIVAAFANQEPIEPPKDDMCYLWAEAWRMNDSKESVEVKISIPFNDYLSCLSAAKKDENPDLFHIVFEDYSNWKQVKQVMQQPSDFAYLLSEGGFALEKETEEKMEIIQSF